MKIIKNLLVTLPVLTSSTLLAAETSTDPEVLRLRKQLEELKAGYNRQAQLINVLESSLQRLEGGNEPTATRQVAAAVQQQPPITTTAQQPPVAKQVPAAAQQQAPIIATAPQTPQPQEAKAEAKAKEETVVKEAPRNTSVNTLLQEEHGLFGQNFSFELGATYAHFSRAQINLSGFLALDAIFLGRISVDQVKSDIVTTDLTARYGLGNRLQFDLNAPFLYRNSTYFQGNVGGETGKSAEGSVTLSPQIGDANTGMYYQLVPESADLPDIVWNIRAKAPTGTNPYGIGTQELSNGVKVPEALPSGNGVWAYSTGFSFVKTVDPAILFANLNFFHNFEGTFNDPSGNKLTADLGNAYQFGLGTAFALNERLSMSFSYTQRFSDKARTKVNGGDWQSIVGSEANAATVNMGVTFAVSKHLSAVTNIGIGLTSDAPDAQLGIRLPYQF